MKTFRKPYLELQFQSCRRSLKASIFDAHNSIHYHLVEIIPKYPRIANQSSVSPSSHITETSFKDCQTFEIEIYILVFSEQLMTLKVCKTTV